MIDSASVGRVRLAAYVLTLNEELHVGAAVRSLRMVTEHVLVVDSASTDGTVEEAVGAGADVEVRPFDCFEKQRNFAIDRLIDRFDPEWVLTIDADERLSPGLVDELRTGILGDPSENTADAYMVPLAIRFGGRVLRHGGLSRSRLLRVYRPTAGRYEGRSVNEHFTLAHGQRLGSLASAIVHEDVVSWERHIAKHNRYSTLEANERVAAEEGRADPVTAAQALHAPYLRRRWLREQVWNHMPAKPFLRFVQMYILSAGFLDGRPGFDVALFQSWQEMCTEKKFEEISRKNKDGG